MPADCEEGQIAEWNGENWECAERTDIAPPEEDGLTVSSGEPVTILDGTIEDVTAQCAEGQTALTGTITPVQTDLTVTASVVADGLYTATVENNTGSDVDVTAHAICTTA